VIVIFFRDYLSRAKASSANFFRHENQKCPLSLSQNGMLNCRFKS